MGDGLTDEAKAEIKAAIRIVREDKWDSYVRETLGKHKPEPTPTDPPKPPDTPANPPGPNPPPAKDPGNPDQPPPTPRKGLWWPAQDDE